MSSSSNTHTHTPFMQTKSRSVPADLTPIIVAEDSDIQVQKKNGVDLELDSVLDDNVSVSSSVSGTYAADGDGVGSTATATADQAVSVSIPLPKPQSVTIMEEEEEEEIDGEGEDEMSDEKCTCACNHCNNLESKLRSEFQTIIEKQNAQWEAEKKQLMDLFRSYITEQYANEEKEVAVSPKSSVLSQVPMSPQQSTSTYGGGKRHGASHTTVLLGVKTAFYGLGIASSTLASSKSVSDAANGNGRDKRIAAESGYFNLNKSLSNIEGDDQRYGRRDRDAAGLVSIRVKTPITELNAPNVDVERDEARPPRTGSLTKTTSLLDFTAVQLPPNARARNGGSRTRAKLPPSSRTTVTYTTPAHAPTLTTSQQNTVVGRQHRDRERDSAGQAEAKRLAACIEQEAREKEAELKLLALQRERLQEQIAKKRSTKSPTTTTPPPAPRTATAVTATATAPMAITTPASEEKEEGEKRVGSVGEGEGGPIYSRRSVLSNQLLSSSVDDSKLSPSLRIQRTNTATELGARQKRDHNLRTQATIGLNASQSVVGGVGIGTAPMQRRQTIADESNVLKQMAVNGVIESREGREGVGVGVGRSGWTGSGMYARRGSPTGSVISVASTTTSRAPLTWNWKAATAESMIGLRVERGPDWEYGDQDGGRGAQGIVTRLSSMTGFQVMVKWDRGPASWHEWDYRWGGALKKYDIRPIHV